MTKKKLFQRSLLRWYRKNGRHLPWRRTRDPYRILVSECMLQQTQVEAVLPYYRNWLRRFPNFAALTRASEDEVLHAWQGLGYYARARNLHRTAKLVMDRHRGRFPRSIDEMRVFPGIGKYTAHAVASFAFGQPAPIVEANTVRVLSRLFDVRTRIDATAGRKKIWSHATALVPRKSAAIYNSALLDLGALVCLPRNPKCDICPVRKFCAAKDPHSLPIKRARPQTKRLVERHVLAMRDGKLLLTKAARRWRGMWILPAIKLDRSDRSSLHSPIYASVFPFTNHRIRFQIFRAPIRKIDSQEQQRWFSRRELEAIAIPSPHRCAIEQLFAHA